MSVNVITYKQNNCLKHIICENSYKNGVVLIIA